MKIYKLSARTDRDKREKNSIVIYHISQNRLSSLQPRSKLLKTGRIGLFFSESYKSIIKDWAYFVRDKKHKSHHGFKDNTEIEQSLQTQIDNLKAITPSTDRIQQKILDLQYKIDHLPPDKSDEDKDIFWDSVKGYGKLYIHKVRCPRSIFDTCRERMQEAFVNDPVKSWGFWGWGDQTFIDAEFLPNLSIIGIEEMNISQLYDTSKNIDRRRFLQDPYLLWQRQEEREFKAREQKRIQDEKDGKVLPKKKPVGNSLVFTLPDLSIDPKSI